MALAEEGDQDGRAVEAVEGGEQQLALGDAQIEVAGHQQHRRMDARRLGDDAVSRVALGIVPVGATQVRLARLQPAGAVGGEEAHLSVDPPRERDAPERADGVVGAVQGHDRAEAVALRRRKDRGPGAEAPAPQPHAGPVDRRARGGGVDDRQDPLGERLGGIVPVRQVRIDHRIAGRDQHLAGADRAAGAGRHLRRRAGEDPVGVGNDDDRKGAGALGEVKPAGGARRLDAAGGGVADVGQLRIEDHQGLVRAAGGGPEKPARAVRPGVQAQDRAGPGMGGHGPVDRAVHAGGRRGQGVAEAVAAADPGGLDFHRPGETAHPGGATKRGGRPGVLEAMVAVDGPGPAVRREGDPVGRLGREAAGRG